MSSLLTRVSVCLHVVRFLLILCVSIVDTFDTFKLYQQTDHKTHLQVIPMTDGKYSDLFKEAIYRRTGRHLNSDPPGR